MKSEDYGHNSFDPQHKYRLAHPILYVLSQYVWLLGFALIYLIISNEKKYSKSPEIKSHKPPIKWNSTYNPHIFGFMSDLHITPYYPQREADTKTILNIYNESGVEKILIAGDIGDNYETNSSIKYGHQYEKDFIQYKKIVDEYPTDLFIVASGNHDEFGVESYNSKDHYILKYCDFYHKNSDIYKNYDNFLISKFIYDDVEFIVLNPYHYPTVRAGIGYYMSLTTEMLDTIEKVLSEKSDSSARFFLTHSPLSFSNWWVKSSSQKSLIEIATSSKITAFLVGHTHIEKSLHRNGLIEIHSIPVMEGKLKGRGYGYFTFDNGGFSYHSFNLKDGKPPLAVMTYPIEKIFVSEVTDFSKENYETAEIRVVYFSENSKLNITVSCSNGYINKTGTLKFVRFIRPNQSLYSTCLKNLCQIYDDRNDCIEFHLTFSGDWQSSSDFVVGDFVTLDKELLETDYNQSKSILVTGILAWISLIFIWCPFLVSPNFCDEINLFICGSNNGQFLRCIFGIIFGPFAIKSRIYHNVSKRVQFVYFFLALSPFFVPYCLMKIGEKSFGFIYFCGYFLKKFEIDFWALSLFGFFSILILTPSTIVFASISQISQTLNWSFVFVLDVVIAFLQPFFVFVAVFKLLYQPAGLIFSITSPIFAFVPLVIWVMEGLSVHDYLVKRSTVYQKLDESKSENEKNEIEIEEIV